MATPRTLAPVPLRVVVLGASASVNTSWHGGPRADLAYPRVVEAALWAAGVPAVVRVSARPADRVRHGIRSWTRDIAQWQPDVVVLHYGQADSVHRFLPRWLERHANTYQAHPFPLRQLYRKLIVRPTWLGLANLQRRLDRPVDPAKDTRRGRRTAVELARLLELSRCFGAPLVLVPTLVRPGPPWQLWFPGAAGRMAELNRQFATVVRQADDPDVRTFPLAELVHGLIADDEEPTPDGGHFTPPLHHAIGMAMAQEVLEWAAARPKYLGRHADL